MMAGAERSLAGREGSPSDIEDLERNTELWYTSLDATKISERIKTLHRSQYLPKRIVIP
jgi:hypothetical protein